MGFIELFILAVGLSMDAFAISIVNGLGMKRFSIGKALIVGLYYGIAQALMPIIGYFVGRTFADMISAFDHWIAFVLLGAIGAKMLYEGLKKTGEDEHKETSLSPKAMLPLAVADSIDALAVGVTFSFLDISIFPAASLIGVTTLLISMIGVKIGNVFGLRFKSKAEIAGGIILILIGLKTLLEHLGLLPF